MPTTDAGPLEGAGVSGKFCVGLLQLCGSFPQEHAHIALDLRDDLGNLFGEIFQDSFEGLLQRAADRAAPLAKFRDELRRRSV
jgi:hypothetical protein